RNRVRVPDTVPTDSDDSVEETSSPLSVDSDSVPIPSPVTVSPSPDDLPIALHE
ncbi:hypothetical protein A2U01_0104638, partial [Trifolium medium]|nr:hypothetical protein [Trifolium medium]